MTLSTVSSRSGKRKSIYDPVHRFIHVDAVESLLIKSPPFQRLRYIHQLGVTFFIYPGATHTRFEHSLGVMELASRIYDHITKDPPPSVPIHSSFEHTYWRRILRLSALCHDLGHLPFSHVAESVLLGEGGHETLTHHLIKSSHLLPIFERLQKDYPEKDVQEDVIKISIGEEKYLAINEANTPFSPWEQIVTEILTGDCFGADRIDYLLRDGGATGLAYGLFDYHQLIESLVIIPSCEQKHPLQLGVKENGLEACEALLLSRYYMYKRLYQYPKVKAYSYHLKKFMGKVYPKLQDDLNLYVRMTDNEVLSELNCAAYDPSHIGYIEAKSLYLREDPFRAIPFTSFISKEERDNLEKRLLIPSNKIEWEMAKGEIHTSLSMQFPVLLENGSVEKGEELTDFSIPKGDRHWVYIAPEYEDGLRGLLSKKKLDQNF